MPRVFSLNVQYIWVFTKFIGCILDYAIIYFPFYNIKTENKLDLIKCIMWYFCKVYQSIDYLQSWLDFVFPNNDDLPVTMTESRAMGVRVVQIFPPFFRLNFRPFTTWWESIADLHQCSLLGIELSIKTSIRRLIEKKIQFVYQRFAISTLEYS